MKNLPNSIRSFGHAVLVFIYISGVAWLMFNGEKVFGDFQNFWGPVFMLLLFVVSATIVGTLVLGKPILLYMDGQKKEAFKFLLCTLGWIISIAVVILIIQPWR